AAPPTPVPPFYTYKDSSRIGYDELLWPPDTGTALKYRLWMQPSANNWVEITEKYYWQIQNQCQGWSCNLAGPAHAGHGWWGEAANAVGRSAVAFGGAFK